MNDSSKKAPQEPVDDDKESNSPHFQVKLVSIKYQPSPGIKCLLSSLVQFETTIEGMNKGGEWLMLYISQDEGKTWYFHSQFPYPPHGKFTFPFPDGNYGFFIVPVDKMGYSGVLPIQGTTPMKNITIDTVPPNVHLEAMWEDDMVRLKWKALDTHILLQSVVIDFSLDNGENWKQIASGLRTTGEIWEVFGKEDILLRVRARDGFNNEGEDRYILKYSDTMLTGIPEKGKVIQPGKEYKLEWKVPYKGSLCFSSDNGKSWEYLKNGLLGEGDYIWKVPSITTSNALFRVVTGSTHQDFPAFAIDSSPPQFEIQVPLKNSKSRVTVDIKAHDEGEAGLAWVELWHLKSENKWSRVTRTAPDAPGYKHFTFCLELPDGRHSFSAAACDCIGNATQRSKGIDIIVDTVCPKIQFDVNSLSKANSHIIIFNWLAQDSFLGKDPVFLYYSLDYGNTWIIIAENLPSIGKYEWKIAGIILDKDVYFKLKVQDLCTNVSEECIYKIISSNSMNSTNSNTNKLELELPPPPLPSNFNFLSPDQGDIRFQKAMRKAIEIRERKDWIGAEEKVKEAIMYYPQSWEAHYLLALIYRKQRKPFQNVIEELKNASKINPYSSEVYNDQGVEYLEAAKFDEAFDAFQQAIKLNPQNNCYLYNLAIIHFLQSKYKECLQIMQGFNSNIGDVKWYLAEARKRIKK